MSAATSSAALAGPPGACGDGFSAAGSDPPHVQQHQPQQRRSTQYRQHQHLQQQHQHQHLHLHHQRQQPKMPGCVWTNEAVTLLLSLYLREQQLARPQKLKKKDVWRGICTELWRRGLVCSWQECDKKYRNLKQTFVRNLKQAGKKECRWMFFPLMLEINRHEPFVGDVLLSGAAVDAGLNGSGSGEDAAFAALHAVPLPVGHGADETDAIAAMDEMEDAASYTPGVMNLSQRQDRTPELPLVGMPTAKRRRRADERSAANGFEGNATHSNCHNDDNNPVIVKLEDSLPLAQTPKHPIQFPALDTQPPPHTTAIKRSISPRLNTPQASLQPPLSHAAASDENCTLVPLDIRLLQAVMPFARDGRLPAAHSMDDKQLQHHHQHHHHHAAKALAATVKSTALNSPSATASSEENCNEDDVDDADGDGDINGNIRSIYGPKAALCTLLSTDNRDAAGDDEETRSMPDADEPEQRPYKESKPQQQQQEHQQQQQTPPQPPKWFNVFMAEFRRHENRKLQQIAELCAEVRRTNDIEQQRNHILSEKNEILRHMNTYMLNK